MALSIKTAVWIGLCISALFCGNQIRYTSNTAVHRKETLPDYHSGEPEKFLRSLLPSSSPQPSVFLNNTSIKSDQGEPLIHSGTTRTLSEQLNRSSAQSVDNGLGDGAMDKPEVEMVDVPKRPLLRFKLISKADPERRKEASVPQTMRRGRLLKRSGTSVKVLPKKYGKPLVFNEKLNAQHRLELQTGMKDYGNGLENGSVDYVTYERSVNKNNDRHTMDKQRTMISHDGKEDNQIPNQTFQLGNKTEQTTFNPWRGKNPKIPHIIHQTWDSANVPDMFSDWMRTWTKNHPDWEYWFWTQKDVRLFLSHSYPDFLQQYDAYEKDIYRANAMRFYVMYHFGGIYADLDLESLKPMDPWTYTEDCFLPEETYAHPIILRQQEKSNAMITLLACRPHHPFFKLAIDMLPTYNELEYESKLLYIDNVYRKFTSGGNHVGEGEEVKLVHPDYFLPTYDQGWTARIRSICQTSNILPSSQREVCELMAKDDFKNSPKNTSYTNHHWIHVVMLSDSWKRKNTRHISSIIPNTKDLQSLLKSL